MRVTHFEIMTLLKSKQILFTSWRSQRRTSNDKNYNNIFFNWQNWTEISVDLSPILKHFVRKFVTMMWHKIVVFRFGIRYQLLWPVSKAFVLILHTKDICFSFRERFGIHEVNFKDPDRPRTPKESAKVLTEIFNTRKIPDRFLD